jgi:hypothetical protein
MKQEKEERLFHEILADGLERHGITSADVLKESGVPDSYFEALLAGEFKKLPAAPYVRGYIYKIAPLIEMDGGELWALYKKENQLKVSGPNDNLPSNRFALKSRKIKYIVWAGFAALLVLVYVFFNLSGLTGTPTLEVFYPQEELTLAHSPTIRVGGVIEPRDRVLINGSFMRTDDGRFDVEFPLREGLNTITFSVKRMLGKEITAMRQVLYEPDDSSVEPGAADALQSINN